MNKEQKPGTFRELSVKETEREYEKIVEGLIKRGELADTPLIIKKIELEVSRSLISAYKFFQRKFGTPKSIIYPCCYVDTSPTIAFPNSRIVYVDNNPKLVEPFKRKCLDFVCADAREYHPRSKHDLLLILNPTLRTEGLTHLVVNNGLIIANNYHHNVTQMFEQSEKYTFEGLIDDRDKRHIKLVGKKEADAIYAKYCDYLSVFRKK